MTTTRVTRTATFAHADVQTILAAAGDQGRVLLVKDDGAYLITGTHPDVTVVYARGFDSPNHHHTGKVDDLGFDEGWLAQRRRIEETFGGDDFVEDVDLSVLRDAAQVGSDVVFDLTVLEHTWEPGTAPAGLGPGTEKVTRLEDISDPRPASLWLPATTSE